MQSKDEKRVATVAAAEDASVSKQQKKNVAVYGSEHQRGDGLSSKTTSQR